MSTAAPTRDCRECGAACPPSTNRPRLFCSALCKSRAKEARRKQARDERRKNTWADCQLCGKRFQSHLDGARPRKFCTSEHRRLYTRIANHGLTPEAFKTIWVKQEGKCGICREKLDLDGRDGCQIDHDHECCHGGTSCGKCVRGLLCGPCNRVEPFLTIHAQRGTLPLVLDWVKRERGRTGKAAPSMAQVG